MKWMFLGIALAVGVSGIAFMLVSLQPEGDSVPMTNERRRMLIEVESKDEHLFI
jgi:hypothetical protein